jgi:hypothetical protein
MRGLLRPDLNKMSLDLRKRTAVCPNQSDEEYHKFVTTVNMTTAHHDLYVKSPATIVPRARKS